MKTNNKKVEDKFYGKRVVKGIFARVNISSQINAAKQLGVQMARENKSSEYGDSRWNTLLNETYKMVGGENTDQGSNVGKQLRAAWKSANEKEQSRINKIQQDATFKLESTVRSLKSKLESKGFCSNKKNCTPQDKALQQEIGEAFSYETSDQQFISLIRKMTARLGQPFGAASKNSRIGGKAIFAATKEQTINEIRSLKTLIQTYENQLKTYKNLLKSALKYLKTLGEGEGSFSRTGAKAKFSHLSTMLDMLDYQSANDQEDLARKNIKGLAQSIGKLNPTKDEWSRYVKIAKSLGFSESQISGFARTGGKAKFAKMSPEKVKILTEAVQQIVKEKPLITRKYYADHGLSEMRWFWDIFHAAGKKLPPNFSNDLYKDGLNDSHIQTVLKSALKSYSSRTGAKAKFAKEYILWAVPKGKTDTMYSQPIAEQLYTDAQINEVKRKATAAGWHTFRIAEIMSFEDMTNAFKGKPVKRRSSRTGAKAKFSMSVSYDPATELLTVGNKHYKCSRSQSGYVLNVLRNVRNAKNPSNEQARAIDEFQKEGIISITDKTFNSKARFANEEIAEGLSKVLKANGFNAMASEVLSGSTDSETLRKYIRALKSKMSPMSGNDRGMVLLQTLEKQLASRTGAKAKFAVVGDIVKVRQGHKSVKGEIVKDNGDGTYMIELPNQLYSDGRKIIERVSEARLLLSRTGAKVFK